MQVYAANDVVYEDIAAGFSQLCSSLLPSLELQLVRVGSLAHEGLQFRYALLSAQTPCGASGVLTCSSALAMHALCTQLGCSFTA